MKLSLISLLLTATLAQAAGVAITEQNGARHIKTPHYEAVVDADGCLSSFRVTGKEFFVSRGSYFFQDVLLKLSTVEQPTTNVVVAKSDRASIRYEFAADTVLFDLKNLSDKPILFFIILDSAVDPMLDEQGQWKRLPVVGTLKKAVWFRENARMETTGTDTLWGPWEGDHEVLQVSLAANQKKRLSLKAGIASKIEVAKAAALTAPEPVPVVEQDLTVLSPRNWQVVQRQSKFLGRIFISGRVKPDCDAVEVKFTGKSLEGALPDRWQPVPLVKQTRSFFAELPVSAGGWYKFEARALKAGKTVATATVEKFGVGEVFVGAGQSNSTNCGQEKTKQTSGMVSSFSGTDWRIADDPQPGVADHSQGGSFWPAFGDAMYAKYQVPIGVAATGYGGTSVNAWKPSGDLFRWMMTRISQLGPGGFRAVLWHQGESDVGMKPEEYAQKLTAVIRTSTANAGWQFPWFVAQVSYHNPQKPLHATTRAAQKKLWDDGVALEGPDTDTLTGDNRDLGGKGIHFSPKGLTAHGQMWAEKVGVYLDKIPSD